MRDFLPVSVRQGFRGSTLFGKEWHIECTRPTLQENPASQAVWSGQRQNGLEAVNDMTSWMTRTLIAAVISLGCTGAFAQESTNQVAVMTDWSVFNDDQPMECWGVSKLKEAIN